VPGRPRRRAAATWWRTHGLPADVKTPKDGGGDVHAGAEGGCRGKVGRLRSGSAARDRAAIARSSRKASPASIAGCRNTAHGNQSASTWRKPTGVWRSARSSWGGGAHDVASGSRVPPRWRPTAV
jgi:hypothetical protein